ncbi:MAG TPA: VWA domain-containing protein [Streptosporangiaceae bacterium]|nr:VWA domain-containing protein [Streptosporangiaceae bacterium]
MTGEVQDPAEPGYRFESAAGVQAALSGVSYLADDQIRLQCYEGLDEAKARVRSFVLIDTVDEVTRPLALDQHARTMVDRINRQARAASVDGHSDYGHALETFWRRFGRDVSARTTILILGDARNNHHLSQAWAVRDMSRRARRVFWLNPEPTALWGTGDSIMAEYAPHCDAVTECRNLRQLEHFVTALLLLSGSTPARACLT